MHQWIPPVITGILLALSFPFNPNHFISFLFSGNWAYVALIPLLLSLPSGDRRAGQASPAFALGNFKIGFQRGWTAGFVFNILTLYWVAYTQGGGPAVVAGTALLAVYLGIYVGLFAGVQALLVAGWGTNALLAAPLLWTAQEYLLSLGELGFPWSLLGHSQAGSPLMIQYATVTGVYGVSFWITTVNLLGMAISLATSFKQGAMRAIPLIVVLLAPWLHGKAVLGMWADGVESLRVGVVQPNLVRAEKWGPDGLERSFSALETLSREAVAEGAKLLVWPETALPCYLRLRPECSGRVRGLVDELDVPVLTGASDFDLQVRQPYNSAFYLSPGRAQIQSYSKMHLVPFGERTPYKDSIPWLRDVDWTVLTGDLGPAEFAPGKASTVFELDGAPFSALICFESAFPDLVRRSVAAGARMLAVITNDSWFGRTAGPYQHAQLAVLRAIENRVAIARSANTGVSMFIDPMGRVFEPTDIFQPAVRVFDLPIASESTFYTRHGDLFAQAALAIFLLLIVAGLVKSNMLETKDG